MEIRKAANCPLLEQSAVGFAWPRLGPGGEQALALSGFDSWRAYERVRTSVWRTAWGTQRDLIDGTSQTLLVGERSHRLAEATWVGSVTGTALYPDFDEPEIARRHLEHSSGMVLGHAGEGAGPGDPRSEVNQFFSQHGDGVYFLFCDGHVSFLQRSMDYKSYRALATRAGRETTSGDY